MRGSFVLRTKCYSANQIKDERDGTSGMCFEEEKCMQLFGGETLRIENICKMWA